MSWDSARQRWVASVTVGYTPSGKRIVKRGRGRTKTEAQRKLREIVRDYEDGQIIRSNGYAVTQAVRDWLQFGLVGRDEDTVAKYMILANTHVIPALGARKLRDLSADDVDRWLADKAKTLSTNTLQNLHSILKRPITRAQARDRVKRNVALLWDVPQGHGGRPSKSLTFDQADALLAAAESRSLHAYIVVSLLTGARTEELRALTWSHVVPIEKIARLVGHTGTTTTEIVYRKQIRPVVVGGAEVMDKARPHRSTARVLARQNPARRSIRPRRVATRFRAITSSA
jgi:hypothetical protein